MNNRTVEVRREHEPLPPSIEKQFRVPSADVYESPDAFVLMLDLPGASRETIKLTLEKGEMRVEAGVIPLSAGGAESLVNERTTDGFYRAFSIGEGIDTANVDARFEQGVLTVKLYKNDSIKPREIHIN
jgi:HSP20 family protein